MSPDGSHQTVLVVEDNQDDIFALKWALKKAQIKSPLQVAEHGQQAVDYLSGNGGYVDRELYPIPGLVLLDLKLPYKNGFEVLEWMRSNETFRSLPVVILSGSDETRDHARAEELGACGYMVKPPSPADIASLFAARGLA